LQGMRAMGAERDNWQFTMGMQWILILLLMLTGLTIASPAQAAFCRQIDHHTLCLLEVKRSAKNYWEYRAKVQIDGVEKPFEVYNCRDRVRIQSDGNIRPFAPRGAGWVICQSLKRP
jgi:hypothetical protein